MPAIRGVPASKGKGRVRAYLLRGPPQSQIASEGSRWGTAHMFSYVRNFRVQGPRKTVPPALKGGGEKGEQTPSSSSSSLACLISWESRLSRTSPGKWLDASASRQTAGVRTLLLEHPP